MKYYLLYQLRFYIDTTKLRTDVKINHVFIVEAFGNSWQGQSDQRGTVNISADTIGPAPRAVDKMPASHLLLIMLKNNQRIRMMLQTKTQPDRLAS
jgi:hypothetical protein